MSFSTDRGADRMDAERRPMRNRIGIVVLTVLSGMTPLAAPQAPKATVPRDPEMIDAQGYQKLLEQYPMLNELAKQYAPQGLKVVGVSLDDDGDLILMRRFLARYKPIFPNYRKKAGGEEAFRQLVLPGWTGSLPVTVFYAKDGRQIGHVLGEGKRETYEAAIRTLLVSGSN